MIVPQPSLFQPVRFFPAEREVFRQKESLTPSQRAEKYRVVTMGGHVGPWRNDITPYLAPIMDAWALPHVREVVLCKSPQTGGTQAMYNCLCYAIERDPSTDMIVMPSQNTARKVSEDYIAPMLRQDLRIKNLISDNPDDTAKERIRLRNGEILFMAWSNSAPALASFPIKRLYFDECDKYPAAVGREADPISLGEKRARQFRHTHKIFKVSTPTREDGPIWKAFLRADAEYRFQARCPDCGHEQVFILDNLKWPEDRTPEEIRREHSARYHCRSCGKEWDDRDRDAAVRAGRWAVTKGENVSRPRRVAFHLPSWLSPDVSLSEIAAAFLNAKKDRALLIDFYNDYLAEPFVESEQGESVADETLYNRRRDYAPDGAAWQVPLAACVLTAFADVQQNRIEAEVVAWGPGRESWGVEHRVFPGDPARDPRVWEALDEYFLRDWTHESGARLRVAAAGIDTGYLASEVYRFVRARQARRVYACKGSSTRGKPLFSLSSGAPKGRVKDRFRVSLVMIGTETAKDTLFSWMQSAAPGPGYMHYHSGYSWDYFRQLTAEHAVTRYDKAGRPFRTWAKKHRDARNEALDLRVGNYAVLELLNPNFEALATNLLAAAGKDSPQPPKPKKNTGPRPRSWINGWRR